jgi:O-antigen/teichoic acid export membrane protein
MVPVVKMGIAFIMAPLIVRALGNYDYGIWEMVFAVVGYMGMLDLGLAPAIVRSVARQQALRDSQELQRIYSSAMAFFLPLGLLMALLLVGAAFFSEHFFTTGSGASTHRYTIFLIIVAIQVLVSFVGLIFDCFLEGFQRYSLRNGATVVASIGGALVLYPLLKNGGGLLVLAAGNTAGFALKNLYYAYVLSRPSGGGFQFQFKNVSRATFKELFSFGFKSFVYATSSSVGDLTDKLIVGSFINPVALTFYAIPVSLLSHARNLVWSVTRVFMPVFSELDARNEKKAIRELLFTSSRYALGIILPLIGGICILGPAFLYYWMGPDYALKGRWVLYIMAAAYLLQWLCPFRNRFLQGVNRLEVQARLGVVSVVINLAASVVLVNFLGKEGVALGSLLAAMVIEPYLLFHTCRAAGGSLWHYLVSVYLPLFVPVSVFSVFLCWLVEMSPPQNLFDVVLLAVLSMMIYWPVFFMFGMSRHERINLWEKFLVLNRKWRRA